MLDLTQVEWLRLPILEGLVTCAGAGTETALRASRDSLLQMFADQREKEIDGHPDVFEGLLDVLEAHLTDDRYAIPSVEVLAYLLNSGLMSADYHLNST